MKKFIIISGPCVVESKELLQTCCKTLKEECDKLNFEFIFKSSYKKANRTSINSFTGLGGDIALRYLAEVSEEFSTPVITDIHTSDEAFKAAEFVDCLQIPAFLSRQTELLIAAGKTGKTVNIKKGQFLRSEEHTSELQSQR